MANVITASDLAAALGCLRQAHAEAQQSRQRRMLVISGTASWSAELIKAWFSELGASASSIAENQHSDRIYACIGDDAQSLSLPSSVICLSPKKAPSLLGQNIQQLVFDTWSGLFPDALAAACGALEGGGLLLLRVPPMAQWHTLDTAEQSRLAVEGYSPQQVGRRFLQRFIASLRRASHVYWLEQGRVSDVRVPTMIVPTMPAADTAAAGDVTPPSYSLTAGPVIYTTEQQQAVDAILQVARGRGRRPLVITADRGRGKSTALGLAAAELMRSSNEAIQLVITAPRPAAVETVFFHAARVLGVEKSGEERHRLVYGESSLTFIPPDALVQQQGLRGERLLMIDEAAAIPAPLLLAMTKAYNRTVFATTVHGYEGTGRGFDIRFRLQLEQLSNQVKELRLRQPIRWAADDPLEAWLFDALLLDAAPADLAAETLPTHTQSLHDALLYECLRRDELVESEPCLRQLFGLLTMAHYQTSPSDLYSLLDSPNIDVWVGRYQGQIVAACLMSREGALEAELAEQIWRGQRRPQGHLLPQTLAARCGIAEALPLRYWRVVRIAVHPELQRKGIGRQFLQRLQHEARDTGADFLGSSFAATADVLAFWRSQQSIPLRLGNSRDASSGCFSALVLSALSEAAAPVMSAAQQAFADSFPHELAQQFSHLECELVEQLLRGLAVDRYSLSDRDWQEAAIFAKGGRQFTDCRLSLWRITLHAFSKGMQADSQITPSQRQLMIRRILQAQSEQDLCRELGLTGKGQLESSLRMAVDLLCSELLKQA